MQTLPSHLHLHTTPLLPSYKHIAVFYMRSATFMGISSICVE
jgi:hypothetical protein